MFEGFARNKTRYENGQAFPFLIAIICVIIILAMITINLGQIGLFRTDVSNAADAGALAAASVLSQTLLGLGLRSDMMCGYFVIEIVTIILAICSVIGIPAAIATYIAFLISQSLDYAEALGNGNMGWTNAIKSAVQYGFQNAGVDEPKPTFKQFLLNAYGVIDPSTLGPATLRARNAEYLEEGTDRARQYARSGFSKFMDDPENGFWDKSNFGAVDPGETADVPIESGYGWTQLDNGSFCNSYDSSSSACSTCNKISSYRNCQNYVEVYVVGATTYPLELFDVGDTLTDLAGWIEDHIRLPWWLEWLDEPIKWVLSIVSFIWAFLPAGLTFNDMTAQTNGNHVFVQVSKYKRPLDVGLWNFRYGTVQARAQSHTFRQNGNETIEPVVFHPGNDAFTLWDLILFVLGGGVFYFIANLDEYFRTDLHLFETELTDIY